VFFGLTWKHGVGENLHFRHTLSVRISMLDDGFYDVWPLLLNWLVEHSETEGFVGYTRATYDEYPSLTYFRDGQVYARQIGVALERFFIPETYPPEELCEFSLLVN